MNCFMLYLLLAAYGVVHGLEQYIILPADSDYCLEHRENTLLSVSQHMQFHSAAYNSSLPSIFYKCQVELEPMGMTITKKFNGANVTFLLLRLKVEIEFQNCDDRLILRYSDDKNFLIYNGFNSETEEINCRTPMPFIKDATRRFLGMSWHTANSSTDSVGSTISVDVATYRRYHNSPPLENMIAGCGDGFWCGNETRVCLGSTMSCDGGDSCFDGGSDERGCRDKHSSPSQPDPPAEGKWPSYLPWFAGILIPVIGVFILRFIYIQKQQMEELDDDEQDQENALKASTPPSPRSSEASGYAKTNGSPNREPECVPVAALSNGMTEPSPDHYARRISFDGSSRDEDGSQNQMRLLDHSAPGIDTSHHEDAGYRTLSTNGAADCEPNADIPLMSYSYRQRISKDGDAQFVEVVHNGQLNASPDWASMNGKAAHLRNGDVHLSISETS